MLLGVGNSNTNTIISTTTTTTTPISELSTKEQAQLQSSSSVVGVEEERELLGVLNEEYEKRSGGLRFVTFVNGRGKGEIVAEMRRRMMMMTMMSGGEDGEKEEEMRVAVGAVCDIAEDRVRKLGVFGGGE